jgi:MinD-like ATPase involved in chromosome partitioning or flagellar assembly
MTTASAEAPTQIGWVPVPEHAFNRANRPPVAAAVRLGPLLAVCGLAGGAGVTTLSYLIALAAARQSSEPVLVADTGGPSGGLAACAGVEVPRSLGELAQQRAAGVALGGGIYAAGRDGLRVLAAGPEFTSPRADDQVRELLLDAREAHGLTVIDCGTLTREAEQTAAAAATHVAWMLTATAHGVSRGRRVLDAAPRMAGKELIVARNDVRQANAPLRKLRRIAADRRAPLVLVPHLAGLDAGRVDACSEAAQIPVQAILGALRR